MAVLDGFRQLRLNFWISAGYNINGFIDRDFSKADCSEGPFIKGGRKFDQVSVRDAVKWFSRQ